MRPSRFTLPSILLLLNPLKRHLFSGVQKCENGVEDEKGIEEVQQKLGRKKVGINALIDERGRVYLA